MYRGSMVAIITPMLEDGQIDYTSFAKLLDFHANNGTKGIVVVGTTGESPTLTVDEHWQLIAFAVKHIGDKVAIIAGTGANSTAEAIDHSKEAKRIGAAAGLSVAPYYNRPSQEGLYQHFRQIAEAVDLDMVLYNVPKRTAVNIDNDTALRLAEIPNIVGIKDATANIATGTELIYRRPKNFAVLSGEDISGCALMLMGGDGVISVTANVAPKLMAALCHAATTGDVDNAYRLNKKLHALHRDLFIEPSPAPTKWALSQMNLCQNQLRLPLLPLTENNHTKLRQAMHEADIDDA